MVGPAGKSNKWTASNSLARLRVQSSSTSDTSRPSATAKVRSRSDQRSPSLRASEPTIAPATTRVSDEANSSTRSRTRSRSSTLKMFMTWQFINLKRTRRPTMCSNGLDSCPSAALMTPNSASGKLWRLVEVTWMYNLFAAHPGMNRCRPTPQPTAPGCLPGVFTQAWKGCYPSDREQRCILNVDTSIPS